MTEATFWVLSEIDLLTAASGRIWGIVTPHTTWATYGDLTPNERGNNLSTSVLRYRKRETAERVARILTKRKNTRKR